MVLEPLVAVGYLLGGKVIQFAVALKQSTREKIFRKSPMRSASQMQSLLGESFGKTRKNGEAFRKVPRSFSSKQVRYLDVISKILLVPA